ncbi:MAG: peptidylprolyl isomerase [Tissierellia bacterium]|nr:peptidylprolyl isomerase [Tissierellia bacterium]
MTVEQKENKEPKLVATVGEKKIFDSDVVQYFSTMDPNMAAQFQSEDGVRQVIDELVRQELLYQDALATGLTEDEEFKRVLAQTTESLVKSYAFSKSIEGVHVTEEEALKYYDEHREQFQEPATVRAAHILVDEEEKAKEIHQELQNGGDFGALAREHSTCPSKAQGGDLGDFPRGAMVAEFDEAAWNLKDGELSAPVKTQFGYHIIKRLDSKEATERSFDEARDDIRMELLRLKQKDAYTAKIQELMEQYPVKMY